MNDQTADDLDPLLAFNHQLLLQALDLVNAHRSAGGPAYAGPVGAHLRHVIEHHEALLLSAGGVVDYDARPRDRRLETDPAHAAVRLGRLLQRLADLDPGSDLLLTVRGLCGLDGSARFAAVSSLGRELAFVASHAVHHFALLLPHARQQGLPLPAGFGLAPATAAHRRGLAEAAVASPLVQESPCPSAALPA